jgi:hypothetical protein
VIAASRKRPRSRHQDPFALSRDFQLAPRSRSVDLRWRAIPCCRLLSHGRIDPKSKQ